MTFPAATFRVQEAASHLNVNLLDMQQYLSGMQECLEEIHNRLDGYKATVRREMPSAVDDGPSEGL